MNRNASRVATATVAAALASAVGAGAAGATAGSGASSTIVAQGTTSDQLHVQSNGPSKVVFQKVTLQPGGFTGWHSHPGPLLVVVESGTLTHYDARCGVETYTTGQAFEETPREVHQGANLGSEAVVLDVTYVVPADGPLRDDAVAPTCATSLR